MKINVQFLLLKIHLHFSNFRVIIIITISMLNPDLSFFFKNTVDSDQLASDDAI